MTTNYWAITSKDSVLAHHGVVGMKWGVRRYRNADGSLTPAGKRHESIINRKYDRKQRHIDQDIDDLARNSAGITNRKGTRQIVSSYQVKKSIDGLNSTVRLAERMSEEVWPWARTMSLPEWSKAPERPALLWASPRCTYLLCEHPSRARPGNRLLRLC